LVEKVTSPTKRLTSSKSAVNISPKKELGKTSAESKKSKSRSKVSDAPVSKSKNSKSRSPVKKKTEEQKD